MIELTVIGAYLALLLGLGLFAGSLFRGTSKDYLLASHSIGPVLLLMSLFGTTMTAFALVGSTGEAYTEGIGVYGMLASSSGIIHSLCFFLIGVKLWGLGKKYGYTTQIQFFRDRLQSDSIGLLLFPVLVGLVIPYLLIGVISSGVVMNAVTEGAFRHEFFAAADYGLPKWLGSAIICGVVLVYVFFGGMRGTAWANAFQTGVFMVLGVVTFVLIANKLGGLEQASQAVLEKHPGKLMRAPAEEELTDYEQKRARWETLARYNYAVDELGFMLTETQRNEALADASPALALQAQAAYAEEHNLLTLTKEQRQLALLAQDDREVSRGEPLFDESGAPLPLRHFPRSTEWEERAIAQFADRIGHPADPLDPAKPEGDRKWTRRRAQGVYRAMNWAPEEPHPISKLAFFTYLLIPLSVGMFPHLFQHWLTARSAGSFKLPVVAHPLFIAIVWLPCVLVGVWATAAVVDGRPVIPPHFPPNAVLAKMVKEFTGPFLGGCLTAGILAAIMSSLDSQFLCMGTMFTNDIVVHYGGEKKFNDRQKVLLARIFIVAIVLITYAFSLAEPRRVFQMGVWCFSGFSSLFPLVVAALYWRRLTAAGAIAGALAAIVSWGVMFVQSDFAKRDDYHVFGMMPVVTMLACSTAAMVVVSLLTKPPEAAVLRRFFPEKD